MNRVFRNSLAAMLAMVSLAASGAGERPAAVESRGLTSSDPAPSVAASTNATSARDVAKTQDCNARRKDADIGASILRDARIARMDFDRAESIESDTADVDEQEGIVPAIYTWKPETRFVFYRNVGKWM